MDGKEERKAKKAAFAIRERRVREEREKGAEKEYGEIRVKVEGKEYVWMEEEGRIRKFSDEQRKEEEEEEERRVKRKKED